MNRRLLVVIALAVLDIPLYILIFRALFRLPGRTEEGKAPRSLRPGDLLDPVFMKDRGGETKLLLLLFTAALIVLIEYSLVAWLVPGFFL